MNFENYLTDANSEIVTRLLIATGLGAVVELERQLKIGLQVFEPHVSISGGSNIYNDGAFT